MSEWDDWSLSVAVEDRFVIFGMNKTNGMLPDGDVLDGLIAAFSPLRSNYQPLLDLGDLDVLTTDVMAFVGGWAEHGVNIIVDHTQSHIVSSWPKELGKLIPVDRRCWNSHKISLAHFLKGDDIRNYGLETEVFNTVTLAGTSVPTEEEWWLANGSSGIMEDVYGNYRSFRKNYETTLEASRYNNLGAGEDIIFGSRALRAQLRSFGRNSLMTQLALVPGATDGIVAVPYHANALYETREEYLENSVILGRPSVLAKRTQAILSQELTEFNALLNNPSVSESLLQRFFEKNPSFFKMLGYKSVYPKVVLERDDGTSLQPDFMLEPFDSEFWDILDIKKPSATLIVGSRDRQDFSAQVHQLNAQLREYGAYFDEDKNRKRVADRYGIKAYKPRLVGIIGDNYNISDTMQLQRVRSQYKDVRLLTFAQMQEIARSRLLI